MLVTIRSRTKVIIPRLALLAALALGFSSCATNKRTAFLNDPNDMKETALPWNQQQKWEQGGQAGEINTEGRR